MAKLWGGRFTAGLDTYAARLNDSIGFDWRLAEVDIRGSLAWAKAIHQAGVLTEEEAGQICAGLEKVLAEVQEERFVIMPSDEDVHTAVERRLTELIGPAGGKLHTGRSRNDQVATDFRLWLLEAEDHLDALLREVQSSLLARAEADFGVVMPGYTHVQRAQPILLSHWWLGHFWPLSRDRERLNQARRRVSALPLGSGALAGTPVLVDREFLASELGFDQVSLNSLDAISDRDVAAEFLFIAAMIGVHLSRLSEALILFSSAEFGFFDLPDAYATGSSLMPQKKNPDTLELTRGKAGSLIGKLTGLLATLKGLPSTYDKDLQEDKVPVFEAVDALAVMLPVMSGLLGSIRVRPEGLKRALDPAMLATDLADYLVAQGVPFREAHSLVGKVVRFAQEAGLPLDQVPLEDLRQISPVFTENVRQVFDFKASADRRAASGGTASAAVRQQIKQAAASLG